MFSNQYDFLLEDFEKKLSLINDDYQELKLIKGDLENFIINLFSNLGQFINFSEIESQLDDLQKIDIQSLSEAIELFNKNTFLKMSFPSTNNKILRFDKNFNDLKESIKKIKGNELSLGSTEILCRIELFLNGDFQKLLIILGDKAPITNLQKIMQKKLDSLSDNDIKKIWSSIKEELQNSFYDFSYDEEILGTTFLKGKNIKDLQHKIIQYLTSFRPKMIIKRIKQGKSSSPVFYFGIARILALHHYTKELNLHEIILIKIVSYILEFYSKFLSAKKELLCTHIGINPEGRIASMAPLDIDRHYNHSWIEDYKDKKINYQIVFLELKRLIKIANYYVTRQTKIEKVLFQYKLKYEVFAKENNTEFKKKKNANELRLQKELCVFLLERDIYSYGKKFAHTEIDLMINQPGETHILEVKIYKDITSIKSFEQTLNKNIIQLKEYLDKEPNICSGVLVLYNTTEFLIQTPKKWFQNSFWILPINISKETPSTRKKIITIEEDNIKKTIRCFSNYTH